jgi:hypothetical protein
MGLPARGSARMGLDMTSSHDIDPAGHDDDAAHPGTEDHGVDPGHDGDAHGGDEFLGPIDVIAWGAGVFGIVLGLAVGLAFALATGAV